MSKVTQSHTKNNSKFISSGYCSQRQPIVVNELQHTMGKALKKYIQLKVHHLIQNQDFTQIDVVGNLDREKSLISTQEKPGKVENWQRPTALVRGKTITIECFPGISYVQQNAALIASYLAMEGKDPSIVKCELPTEEKCQKAISTVGLESVPVSDWLIIGANLTDFDQGGLWQQNDYITWSQQSYQGVTVSFLFCHFNFWADILERVTRHLVALGHSQLIYTAKVGALNKSLLPNRFLASGSETVLHSRLWQWKNIFQNCNDPQLVFGSHLNSAITLQENKDWLKFHHHYDFVDSEIGHFIAGAEDAKVRSYIHFISNNLTDDYSQNLSNERSPEILKLRGQLSKKIKKIIWHTITQ